MTRKPRASRVVPIRRRNCILRSRLRIRVDDCRPARTIATICAKMPALGVIGRSPKAGSPACTHRSRALLIVGLASFYGLVSAAETTQRPQETPDGTTGLELSVEIAPAGDAAWQPLEFRSIERHTNYEVRIDASGRSAFRAQSECGASAMSLLLPKDLDLTTTPRLAWRWRIERGLDITAETTRSGDDFAARVYVLFEFDADSAGPFERLERAVGRRLFGVDLPGKTINYVWASRVPVGQTWTSPHHDDAKLIAIATNSSGSDGGDWEEQVVDIEADARRLFSPGPSQQPYALALMVDADDTCSTAVAWFSDFRLLGPELTGPVAPSEPLLKSPARTDP